MTQESSLRTADDMTEFQALIAAYRWGYSSPDRENPYIGEGELYARINPPSVGQPMSVTLSEIDARETVWKILGGAVCARDYGQGRLIDRMSVGQLQLALKLIGLDARVNPQASASRDADFAAQ